MAQNPADFNQSSDFAAMVSRGSVELSITIPEGFSLPPDAKGGQHAEADAPNADTFYVLMKSSRDNIWKAGRGFMTAFDAAGDWNTNMPGSVRARVNNGKITLDSYFWAQGEPQSVPFGQTITAKLMFFDQPL